MTVDLRFASGLGPQPGGAVVLVFGGTPTPPVIPPATTLRAYLGAPWRRAGALSPRSQAAGWRDAAALPPAEVYAPWHAGASTGASTAVRWRTSLLTRRGMLAPWQRAAAAEHAVLARWITGQLLREPSLHSPWQAGTPIGTRTWSTWRGGLPVFHIARSTWHGGRQALLAIAAPFKPGQNADFTVKAPWQSAHPLVSLGGPWTPATVPVTPAVPCWQPEPGNAVTLLLREALTGLAALVFACRKAALKLVPIRRVYMVTNVTSLVRVSDGADIPCVGFSLGLDADSWAWSFSASVLASAIDLIQPVTPGEPVELEADVNGTLFRLVAESLSRERSFGQATLRVQGRGKTAVLAAPYSPLVTYAEAAARTSQQLLDGALPVGWTANWGLTAWLVPGGNWSHQGTPATAAVAIAAAGGGYIRPSTNLSEIDVLPRYPTAPWDWGGVTPDLELPSAVTSREAIEWLELPRYNGVYISGATGDGVLNLVKRTGTAGDVLAPMVSDPLNTHADASRQRGLAVLGRTGRWADVTLRLPVLPETDVILPGQFVRYVDGATTRVGLVRGVSVDVAWPEVWQSIKVETYVA